MRVLAIDPGFDRLGIAIVEGDPSKPRVIWSDCVIPPRGTKELRLATVLEATAKAIEDYSPTLLAIESLFFNKNIRTGIGVAEARGAILSAAGARQLPVREYSPQQVKLAVTGYGSADKTSVARMVPRLVSLIEKKRLDDELDAIALGIAALANRYPQ